MAINLIRRDLRMGRKVVIYARVSTEHEAQISALENQVQYYDEILKWHPDWDLVERYIDEGITGTSINKRQGFLRMMADAEAGKFDLIVTREVSRFARNVLDCIGYVRKLAAMQSPIGVFFETENIYTLNSNSEMSLSFISTLAQEESHNKSEIMNASIEMRFRRGIFLTPALLGYDKDENGNLVINEEEAKTVRLIFFMYLYGYSTQIIAATLTRLGRCTKKGNNSWSASSVLVQLQNERHCGDVLARKTFTPSYLDHKSKKNRQDRNQYRQKNHHEAIISRDDFIAVQRLISNAKYGNKGILPSLSVIKEGALKGYVSINPRWSGFKASDYRAASASAYEGVVKLPSNPVEIKIAKGSFDLRGYEVARSQFFSLAGKVVITFSYSAIKFNKQAISRINSKFVELFIHPNEGYIATRIAKKEDRNAMNWSTTHNGKLVAKTIAGKAFLPNLYELFGWDPEYKYRIVGVIKEAKTSDPNKTEILLLFSLADAEILIPKKKLEEHLEGASEKQLITKNNVRAIPKSWTRGFGNEFYKQQASLSPPSFMDENWIIDANGENVNLEPEFQPTGEEELQSGIHELIESMDLDNTESKKEERDGTNATNGTRI